MKKLKKTTLSFNTPKTFLCLPTLTDKFSMIIIKYLWHIERNPLDKLLLNLMCRSNNIPTWFK